MMPVSIPERRIQEIWQTAAQRRKDLITGADVPVKIIYPGRLNDGRGADFKDAVIQIGKELFKGDIEIHVRSSAWKEHHHDIDPAYNQVVLHVVYENDAVEKAGLQNGLKISTLPLMNFTEKQAARRVTTVFTDGASLPCTDDPEIIIPGLYKAGEARFMAKARDYQEDILKRGAGQTLYRGMMTALGYAKNKIPMAKLADFVPLDEIEALLRITGSGIDGLTEIEARLLGEAGLLSAPSVKGFEALTEIWQKRGRQASMNKLEWEFFKVRPGNYPTRRIMEMAALLAKLKKEGLLAGLEALTYKSGENAGKTLTGALTDAEKNEGDSLIGPDRAGDLVTNVVLPFYYAYAVIMRKPNLGRSAVKVYQGYRGGGENSLEKHMRQQFGLSPKAAAPAGIRQGLIHLYKTFCTQGKCIECPLLENLT